MPTAMRRWCGSGDWPGSEIWSNDIAVRLLSQLVETGLYVVAKALNEHKASDLLGRGLGIVFFVQQLLDALQSLVAGEIQLVGQRVEFDLTARLFQSFAPRHLLHQ